MTECHVAVVLKSPVMLSDCIEVNLGLGLRRARNVSTYPQYVLMPNSDMCYEYYDNCYLLASAQ